jgi:hypothetical protein
LSASATVSSKMWISTNLSILRTEKFTNLLLVQNFCSN